MRKLNSPGMPTSLNVRNILCIRYNDVTFTAQFYPPQKFAGLNPYPTAFPYGNGMVLHFYQQQESSTTKTVHRVINKGLKTYV